MHLLDNIIDELFSGKITIAMLKLVTSEKTNFINLVKIQETKLFPKAKSLSSDIQETRKVSDILKVIALRVQEMEKFDSVSELIRHFINMTSALKSGEFK